MSVEGKTEELLKVEGNNYCSTYTKECISMMVAFLNGSKIQCKRKYVIPEADWVDTEEPSWDFLHYDYRVKPESELSESQATGKVVCDVSLKSSEMSVRIPTGEEVVREYLVVLKDQRRKKEDELEELKRKIRELERHVRNMRKRIKR